jgi:hypothetical protein
MFMSYASTASLVLEFLDGAYTNWRPAMEDGEVPRFRSREAAPHPGRSRVGFSRNTGLFFSYRTLDGEL